MKPITLAALAATIALPALSTPAAAQSREYRQEVRECNRELRRSDSRAEYRSELRECRRELARQERRDWRRYGAYDHNRYEPGTRGYYADRYYRDGRYYADRRLTRNDRIYRGNDGRYYCRRDDGTTGLIVGGAIGALLGREIDRGGSRVVGTVVGGGAGALLGREIDRGNVRCN